MTTTTKRPAGTAGGTQFERETCGRCGGTGHYSYNPIHGTVCLGCGGAGVKLTKLGKKAADLCNSLLQVPAIELKVGDLIQVSGVTIGGALYRASARVIEIRTDPATFSMRRLGPDNKPIVEPGECEIIAERKDGTYHSHHQHGSTLTRTDRESAQAALRAALDFQAAAIARRRPRKAN